MKIYYKSVIACVLLLGILQRPATASSPTYGFRSTGLRHSEQVGTLAKQSATKKIITTIKLEDVEEVLRRSNILYRRESASALRFDVNTYKLLVILLCKDSPRGCPSAIMVASFQLATLPSPNLVNEWNRTKAGTRAYLGNDGSVTLESDIVAEGGITTENLTYRVAMFAVAVDSFVKHIGFK